MFLFGLGMQAVAQAQDDEKLPLDGQAATREFFRLALQTREFEAADQLLCSDYSGLTSEQLRNEFSALADAENAGGLREINVRQSEPPTTPESFVVRVTYGDPSGPSVVVYESVTTANDDDDCIAQISEREPTTEPEPSSSPTEPKVAAKDVVNTFTAAVFQDQDEALAESLQCSDYTGQSIDELLAIRANHDGGDETRVKLDVTPHTKTEPYVTTHDRFKVLVDLDDDTYEFYVTTNPDDPQRCVSSVTIAS
ncbi:hypothetical protein ACFQ3B_09745 [Stackebrandtia endophytica]|uniref:hypothetical protein n=1 Tax=Stackebrandtia endophytica TaxID=1496996 RepID=UPI001152BF96|nr:hypothetical protein [Stackebrandtia endophytica]